MYIAEFEMLKNVINSVSGNSEEDYTKRAEFCTRLLDQPEMNDPNKRIHYEILLAETLFTLVTIFHKEKYRDTAIKLFEKAVQYGKNSNSTYPENSRGLADYSVYQKQHDELRKE